MSPFGKRHVAVGFKSNGSAISALSMNCSIACLIAADIDPDSHTVRSYYPDFLFQKNDDTYVIVEVKGDHEIDNPVVQAKKTFAEAIAGASKMTYRMLESSKADAGIHSILFEDKLQAS